MLVMTAKVDKKKIAVILAAAILLIAGILMLAGGGRSQSTAAAVGSNDARVAFLKNFGWEVAASPTESSQVKIPSEPSEVLDRYNAQQKSQGYDLSAFAGKTVMRYVYKVNNYPGATEPVFATLLVYKNQIIGGDVTDTAPKGVVRGFKMPKQDAVLPSATEPTGTAPVE